MSSAPQIPPRPGRSQAETSDALQNAPIIPPRPQRRNDRSVSPSRAEFSRSPLNEPPVSMQNGRAYGSTLSSSDLPKRPSSAFHPSVVGEEGLEYSSYDDHEAPSSSPKQTRNVPADLPMHAPTASVPTSTAKSRIQTVTRTDSSQAAAAGVGKAPSEPEVHPLKAKSSFSRSNLSINQSGDENLEHGPPSMGLTVPMLKYAGDAQAPSPAPGASVPGTPGGYFKEGAAGRNHHRKRSSRQEFGPPGSYGLHGHGLNSFHGITEPKDKFEQDWYQKHPEEYKREQGRVYDPGHPSHDWALSSDDLNKLVHQSSSRGLGMGTSPDAIGTPSEQIGFLASEEYASRMSSPRPASFSGRKRLSSGNQPAVSSPLRAASKPDHDTGDIKHLDDDHALESEAEDIIHVDPPAHRHSKIGGGGYDPPKEDFGPEGGNTEEEGGWVMENGYGVPILASDEVAKNLDPSAEYLQPAVSPEQERRGSDYYAGWDSEAPGSYQSGRRSSKDKRSGSAGGLSRVRTREAESSGIGTPLEEIEEYEPLFPEEDEEKAPAKPTAVDHLKRPDLARHHFPSQDVWEDVPESLQYETTVDTPQEPEELTASTTFEHPAKEAARKDGNIPTDRADFLSDEAERMAKPHFKPGVADEMRPNMRHRFPSQDIWEDTPDSLQYQTTVDTPQTPEDLESSTGTLPPPEDSPKPKFNTDVEELRQRPDIARRFPSHDIWEDSPDSLHLQTTVSGPQSPEAETGDLLSHETRSPPTQFGKPPQLPARPARPSKLAEEFKPTPSIPARPPQRLRQVPPADAEVPQIPARPGAGGASKGPSIPERPKPQIPARPARAPRTESQENTLTKSVSNVSAGSAESGSVKSPPEVKAKPAVPARPVNANFASLRAGFMNDLNSRLKVGPVAPKKEEENVEEIKPEEKAPLADARKGRARGPARRKPAAAPATDVPAEQNEASNKSLSLAFSTTTTIWTISEEGEVSVPASNLFDTTNTQATLSPQKEIEKIVEMNTDAAGPASAAPSTEEKETSREGVVNNTHSDPVGAEGDAADASQLSSSTLDRSQAIHSGLADALADSRADGKGPATGSTDVAAHVSEYSSEVPVSAGREGKEAVTETQKSVALSEAAPTSQLPGRFVVDDDEEEEQVAQQDVKHEEKGTQMKDTSAQTGEKDITFRSPTGEEEKMTITLGGKAPEHGDVVKKGNEEKVVEYGTQNLA